MSEPWKPEREWSIDDVNDVIRDRCRDLACRNVIPVGSGWDNAAFLVDEVWIFRFSQRRIAVPLLEQEWKVLPHLAPRLTVPIPHPKWFGQVAEWTFLGYRCLSGQPASDIVLNERTRLALAAPLGRFLRELHDQPIQIDGIEKDQLGRFNIASRHPRAVAMLADCDADVDKVALRRILDEVDSEPSEVVVSHGDLYSRHLLIEEEQLTGVIDWGDVCLAEPAHDLMLPFIFLPPSARNEFFLEYGPISPATESRARFRAIGHTLHVYDYAKSIGDQRLLDEAIRSLQFVIHPTN